MKTSTHNTTPHKRGGGGNLVDSSPKSTQTKSTCLSLACAIALGGAMIMPERADAD